MEIPIIQLGSLGLRKTPVLTALQEGQIIRGFVENIEGNRLVINSGGLKFVAQTDLEVTEGQFLWLKAAVVSPEKLVFKLVDPNNFSNSQLPNSGLMAIYNKLKLPASAVTDLVIKVLMSHGLPVSRELVQEIVNKLKPDLAPAEQEAVINAFLLLKSKKLPLTDDSQKVLLKFFLGKAEPEEVAYALKLLNQVANKELNYPNLYFVWWHNELQQGEIYFWTKNGEQKGRLNSCESIILHFYTQNLGEIWVKLSQGSGKLNLFLSCENQQGLSLFRTHLVKLESLLNEAGYELGSINYSLDKVDSVFALTRGEETVKEYRGIDTKV